MFDPHANFPTELYYGYDSSCAQYLAKMLFTSVDTTRGKGSIRVVVVLAVFIVYATFFDTLIFWKIFYRPSSAQFLVKYFFKGLFAQVMANCAIANAT